MPATISLEQVRTNLVSGFEVANTITAANEIPTELFVYKQADDSFSHVATLFDLAYPTVNTPGTEFYRQDNATKVYDNATTALEFANHVKFRIDTLVNAYNDGDLTNFPGTFNTNHPTP